MLTKLIVVVIDDVCKSNHYALHLKHTVLYVNYTSVKLRKERKEKNN